MSVKAAVGHSGRAQMLPATQAFVRAKPDRQRSHSVAPQVKQSAFASPGQDTATDGTTAGSTLDVKL